MHSQTVRPITMARHRITLVRIVCTMEEIKKSVIMNTEYGAEVGLVIKFVNTTASFFSLSCPVVITTGGTFCF